MFIFYIFMLILRVLLMVAFLTMFESVCIAKFQSSSGPNVLAFQGVLQAMADALKLLTKEVFKRMLATSILFMISRIIVFMMSMLNWSVIRFLETNVLADLNLGVVFILILAILGVYAILMSGWSSNSKYSLLGSLSSTAQMLGYDMTVGLVLFTIILVVGSLNFINIVNFQSKFYLGMIYPLVLFGTLINGLAETSSVRFDLPEAEAELVSGYNTEYSSIGFTLFFLAEYSSIIVMSVLINLLFFGGWNFRW